MCQLELFDKIVTIKICSCQGHQTFNLELIEAKKFILKQSKKLMLWLYVDGVHMFPEKIKIDIISAGKFIILTKALVGG